MKRPVGLGEPHPNSYIYITAHALPGPTGRFQWQNPKGDNELGMRRWNLGKFGIRKSYRSWWPMQMCILRSIASYIRVSERKNETVSMETIIQWDKVSRRLIKQYCTKGILGVPRASQTKHIAAPGLITINPRSEKSCILRVWSSSSPNALTWSHHWV